MNIALISSSYPRTPDDPTGAAGLFVREFALQLKASGHRVLVMPIARKVSYQPDQGIVIEPIPWWGGDRELASMSLLNPLNWAVFIHLFGFGSLTLLRQVRAHHIDRLLCFWVVPSGLFGFLAKLVHGVEYDVWALGSDIWKFERIPFSLGKALIRAVAVNARRVFADGVGLSRDVTRITKVDCMFLPSSRLLPSPEKNFKFSGDPAALHYLFVGRYHWNKGPDVLIRAVAMLEGSAREGIQVHMYGFGPMKSELARLISKFSLGATITLNDGIDAQTFSNLLNSVAYLVIPSRVESIPVVFSDALQLGTPVISTPVGDLERLIKDCQCGILAARSDPESLSRAIERSLSIPREAFRDAAAAAYRHFDIKHIAREWIGN